MGSGYAERTDVDQQQLTAAQRTETGLAAQDQTAQANYRQASDEVQRLRQQLAEMSGQLSADQGLLSGKRAKNAAAEKQLEHVRQEITLLQAQIAAQRSAPTEAQLRALKAKQAQEKKDLLNLAQQLD